MNNSSSDFLHFKKPITNVSARVTLNPNLDLEAHNNSQSLTPNFFRYKTFSITNSKNIQSYSASALPNIEKIEPIINCEFDPPYRPHKTIQQPNLIKIQQIRGLRTKSLAKDSERLKNQQKIAKNKKFSLKYQCYFPLHHKSSTQIQMKSFRHTVQPIENHELPKHKQPDWVEKMESYWKTIKIPKENEDVKIKFRQAQQQLKQGVNSHRFPDFKDSNSNKSIKYDVKGKLIFRQTLQPQVQRIIWETKSPNTNNLATFFKHKTNQKDRSTSKLQKSRKSDFKNFGHQISHPNIFWKNKAVSPPSKPWSPEKIPQQKQLIPPLPIKNNEKLITHRPSFILNKKSLSRFNIMKQLGSGTYTDSFLCMDKKISAIFCLKRYHKATIRNFPQVLQIFIKKFAFQFLAEHPNIIQVYDIFCDGEFVYTIEQYMEGGRLSDHIKQQMEQRQQRRRETKRLDLNSRQNEQILLNQSKIIDKIFDINSALCYVNQSCDTVVKFNSKRIPPLVHGDVRVKSILVNMGVCKLPTIEPLHTKSHYINSYSSPQQIIQQVYLPQSDIWSLGLVLFELCAQRKLFGSSQISQDSQQSNKPGYHVFNVNITEQIQKLPNTTQILKQLMKKLLTIQPEQRPTSDIVMLSNVFKMYGFDIQWKQRRNCKLIKQSEIAKINLKNKITHLKTSFQQEEGDKNYAQPVKNQNQITETKNTQSHLQLQNEMGRNHQVNESEALNSTKFFMKGKNHLNGLKNNDFHYK